MTFDTLGLSPKVVSAVAQAGYTEPTPIQAQAIPHVLEGRDILGIAQTGTGKTASFTLPMLTKLERGRARARMPRTLILEPTRELAAQVFENFERYGANHKLTVALLIGGVSFDEQDKKLMRGADVLIATPGRLLDHFERGRLLMSGVEIFVIDEADRMLDMGFIPDIERIAGLLPPARQTLFFSATMPKEITRLANNFLKDPERIEVARASSTANTVAQHVVKSSPEAKAKRETLRSLLNEATEDATAIIFCNRKRDVGIVERSLRKHGFNAGALHGDMDQHARTATLESFRSGSLAILVASDVAARGLDIPEVSHVFNYDVPSHAEDYVHRIGRTGRAGRSGMAVTITTRADTKALAAIEGLIQKQIDPYPTRAASNEEPEEDVVEAESLERQKRRSAKSSGSGEKRSNSEMQPKQKRGRRNRDEPREKIPYGESADVPAFLLRPVILSDLATPSKDAA
ncbi:MAG: DEAD/DEAH box helicase [Pseudomonadota bacterium]